MSNAKKRIIAASLVGLIIVGGSFYLSQEKKGELEYQAKIAQSGTLNPSRKHIPITDTDADGVPDWQAGFAFGDPIYLDATNTEPYVASDNLTGGFSVPYFKDMMAFESMGITGVSQEQLLQLHLPELEEAAKEKIYTSDDLKNIVNTTDPEALRAYGNLVATQIYAYQVDGEDELTTFTRMTEDNNPKHLEKLKAIEAGYDQMIAAFLELEVPESYVFEHLAVLNSFSALKQNVYGMQQYFDDPVFMIMRWRRVAEDTLGMRDSLTRLHDGLYLDDKVEFQPGDALPDLVDGLQNI